MSASAQFIGYPIRNYTPKEYNGFTQNWDCVQDKRGVMYFGNSSDILEYDGKSWNKIPVAAGVAVRSLCLGSNGTIYVGSVSEFGFLAPQKDGRLIYQSLSKDLPANLKKFADVWKIHEIKQSIIFETSENLFVLKDGKITTIHPTNSFSTLSFKVDDDFYVRERQKGLMKLKGNRLELVKDGELFSDEPILGIIKYRKQKLILTGQKGFYLLDEDKERITHVSANVEEYLTSSGVLGIKWLNDSVLYLNSRAGLIFLNNKLEFQNVITKADGLNDETIAQMFVDQQRELWLSTNNGISRISVNSPLYYYNNSSGFNGSIQAITIYNHIIFVGTTVGMFQANLKNQNGLGLPERLKFEPISGTFFEAWNFHEHKGNLLAATSDGVFCVANKVAKRVTKPYANDVSSSRKNADWIYVSEKGGLRILKNKGAANYEQVHYFDFTADDIMTTEESVDASQPSKTTLWLTTRNKGLIKAVFDENFECVISRYDAFNDVLKQQIQMVEENGQLYFCSAKGVFIYDKSKDHDSLNCFIPAKPKGYAYDQNGVHNAYWDTITPLGKKASSGMLSIEEQPYTFYQNNKHVLWVGLTNELVRFDGSIDKNYKVDYNTLIRKVIIGKDSLLFSGTYSTMNGNQRFISIEQGEDQVETLNYKNNSITFDYSATFFEREEKTKYSYKLIGFDTTWSNWSSNTLKQYTNLFEGEYTFMVRSMNIYQHVGSTATYSFVVAPPWYRTIVAYFVYFVALVLLIFVVVKISMRRLIAAKEKLERIVTERTAEVVNQKEQLEHKNVIIELAYNDIKSSINYAKRIQESILPLLQHVKSSFPESFVLYNPRDVVSGDFYWYAKEGDKHIIACVDCTGHGVPGAFMSMIGNTLLNEIVNEEGIVKPSDILNLLHERVRQSLKQDLEDAETRDGMDLALCTFDFKKGILEYAGANRPIYIVRNNQLEEIKPTKSPIGGNQIEIDRKFVNNEIKILKGDTIYLSTDGYSDQFGGERGKKFMARRLQQTLLEIQSFSMEKQGVILKETLQNWQGDIEQVDDILVIGIKI